MWQVKINIKILIMHEIHLAIIVAIAAPFEPIFMKNNVCIEAGTAIAATSDTIFFPIFNLQKN